MTETSWYQRNKAAVLARAAAKRQARTPDEKAAARAYNLAAWKKWKAKNPTQRKPKKPALTPEERRESARLAARRHYDKHLRRPLVYKTPEHGAAMREAWEIINAERNPRVLLTKEQRRANHLWPRQNTALGRLARLRIKARDRAKANGLPFDLKTEDLVAPDTCPVLGIPIGYKPDTPLRNRLSLDRTVPERGYVKGNVVVMSFRANTLKSNMTVDECRKLLAYMEAHELAS